MIETGKSNSMPKEKDTDTFLTGANVDDGENANEIHIDSIENSQALVEQNLMNNLAMKKGKKNRVGNQSL
jgi:predicted lysophospholipase L1 biosynthesis ABC-type transport system permease subunit